MTAIQRERHRSGDQTQGPSPQGERATCRRRPGDVGRRLQPVPVAQAPEQTDASSSPQSG